MYYRRMNELGQVVLRSYTWNLSAIHCYERGCICEGCDINELYFKPEYQICSMKPNVLELVRVLGIPEKSKRQDIIGFNVNDVLWA
ncbi:MAG: hypothetical protein A2287_04720 [Candidatus Melainabacteria bacterium RIFOXYA12_FULL_32_12]|nr:MAG: hypothetical protein A2287_04720 [Candidatus Melainabacteria bacterium RIFOXYA12_FULL_32_12]